MSKEVSCFGFFMESRHPECRRCKLSTRCEALLVTHGLDLISADIHDVVDNLEDADYIGPSVRDILVKLEVGQMPVAAKVTSGPDMGSDGEVEVGGRNYLDLI